MSSTPEEPLDSRIRIALLGARGFLPASADANEVGHPAHPASLNTLSNFEEFMEEGEYEVALYALAGIASEMQAGAAFWSTLAEAAQLMCFDKRQLERANLK